MNSIKEIIRAIEDNKIIDILCGKSPYEVEVSKFTSDVFPTDINAVLVNDIYRLKPDIKQIDSIFQNALIEMISSEDPSKLYIAILYFDACIFQEERGKASFNIDRELLSKRLKEKVNKKIDNLQGDVHFYNGMIKKNALNNIINFNKYYEKKYGFSIM